MKKTDIIKVICTFRATAEYEVIYASGKTRKFSEYTLPQKAKDFVINLIGKEENIKNEIVPIHIGYNVKRTTYTLL